jgi:gamma-glutamyltranspeptidase
VRELAPVECDYRGYHINSSPPPSSGGVIICEILNVIEGFPLGYLGFHSAESVRVMVEAMRHAFVDRNTLLGDPDFVEIPLSRLLDDAYAAEVRGRINPFRAGVSEELIPANFRGEQPETTHYSIIDEAGNAVAVTYTLNGSFGARVVAAGTGVLLNNEMDDFTAKPGVPNLYGLIQGEANAIEPGKTPLSSMSPTVVTKDGKARYDHRQPGWRADHHDRDRGDRQRHRSRHVDPGSDRRPTHPSSVVARRGVLRALRAFGRHSSGSVRDGLRCEGRRRLAGVGRGGRHPGGRPESQPPGA